MRLLARPRRFTTPLLVGGVRGKGPSVSKLRPTSVFRVYCDTQERVRSCISDADLRLLAFPYWVTSPRLADSDHDEVLFAGKGIASTWCLLFTAIRKDGPVGVPWMPTLNEIVIPSGRIRRRC